MYFAISGRKGHGKDTLAKAICRFNPDYKVFHFADPLKKMAGEIWGLTDEQMNSQTLKEELLYFPIEMDGYLTAMKQLTGVTVKRQNKIAYTPRQILQYFGSDYVRSERPNFWVEHTVSIILGNRNAVIADARFPNEAEGVWHVGGRVIKVIRTDLPVSTDSHQSETSIDLINPDFEIKVKDGEWGLIDEWATKLGSMS
jgi:hypothetical protein